MCEQCDVALLDAAVRTLGTEALLDVLKPRHQRPNLREAGWGAPRALRLFLPAGR